MTHGALRKGALFVSVLLLVCRLGAAGDTEVVRVTRAYDGDSLWLADGREVRLIGVNTPELGRDGAADQPVAAAARDRVNALVRGRTVRIVYDLERFDRHGRTLAYLMLPDGRDLQELLIDEGLGWFIAVAPNTARLAAYRAAEARARAAHRGVWARTRYRPVPAEKLTPRLTGFKLITGRVRSVDMHARWVALHLAPRVTLTMPRGDARSPESLTDRRIVARGWLRAYKNGVRMRISAPAMLEVLP